jgi:RHH-type transcriptional regulator, rel operon repressor / antitoxin RelB
MKRAPLPRAKGGSLGWPHARSFPIRQTLVAVNELCGSMYTTHHVILPMSSTTFTVRVETNVKKRLERLAKSTGRSRSFLAAEALSEYLDVNEWQVAGIRKALASLDRGGSVPHEQVKAWVNSWGGKRERSVPKRTAT